MKEHAICVKGIYKSFGTKKVINDVSFTIKKNEVFGFLGPNGAGKTTLIRIILGLVRADKGTVSINGYDIKNQFKQAIAAVGAVVETPKFYENLTGRQNLMLIHNLHSHIPGSKIDELLSIVDLKKDEHSKVATYSLGMKQRLGLARALLNEPDIVFLDEPMNGLDPQGMMEFRTLIKMMNQEHGVTFFITSHLLHEVEQVCDSIAVLKDGKIVQHGDINMLLTDATETIDIYAKDYEGVAATLSSLSYIHKLEQGRGVVRTVVDKGASPSLINLLVAKNIEVKYVVPQKNSLEEFFLRTTKGDE